MKTRKQIFATVICLLITLTACKKHEGVGGDASINGKIHVRHYNSTFTQFISEYPGADTYVYIIYGDNMSYGQRLKSNYNGEFEFKYLYKGDYKIYTYSRDSTLTDPSGSVSVVKNIHIGKTKEKVDAGTFEIFN